MQRRSDPAVRDSLHGNKRPGAVLHPNGVRLPAPPIDKIGQDFLDQRLPILCIGSSAPTTVAIRSNHGAAGLMGVGLGNGPRLAPRPQTATGQISGCRRLHPIPRPSGRQVQTDSNRSCCDFIPTLLASQPARASRRRHSRSTRCSLRLTC
jgi:hypothetical protein